MSVIIVNRSSEKCFDASEKKEPHPQVRHSQALIGTSWWVDPRQDFSFLSRCPWRGYSLYISGVLGEVDQWCYEQFPSLLLEKEDLAHLDEFLQEGAPCHHFWWFSWRGWPPWWKISFQVQVCRWLCSPAAVFQGLILVNNPVLILDSKEILLSVWL